MLVRSTVFAAALGACLALASLASGEEAPLTRPRVVELARSAPAARVADFNAAVAAAGAKAAGVLALDNPVLSGLGGARFEAGARTFNGIASLSWPIEVGGKRSARVGAARAELGAAKVLAERERRRVVLDALSLHAAILRDTRQLAIASARSVLSERVYAAAQKRHSAGSVPELDVALAAMPAHRDGAARAAARGELEADSALLFALLGMSEAAAVRGDLIPEDEPPTLDAVLLQLDGQPEVRVAASELLAAKARAERERSGRWPTLSLLGQYERDDRADIALIGVSLPLPVLNANRAGVASARGEIDVAQARFEQTRSSAAGQLRALYARYQSTRAAVDALAPTSALATRAVALATRGYELGENDLASVLLVRREAIEAEAALLEGEYAHAAAKLELLVCAGRLPQ